MSDKRVHCKYCDVSYPLWYRTKGGKNKSGWHSLYNHVATVHEEEAIRDGILSREEEPEEEGWEGWEAELEDGDGDPQSWEMMQLYSGGY